MSAVSTTAISAPGPSSSASRASTRSPRRTTTARAWRPASSSPNSRAMLVDRVTSLREANVYERHTYRHFLGQPWIKSQDGAQVASETSFFVVRIMRDGATDIYATGRYLDLYSLETASPKLIERIVVCDSSRFDTLLALPL